jgi:hypothetical protein
MTAAIQTPDTRISPLSGKYAVTNCGEACTEWNCNTIGGDNFLHKYNLQTKSLIPDDGQSPETQYV